VTYFVMKQYACGGDRSLKYMQLSVKAVFLVECKTSVLY